jgi:archaellum component FlaG (FlaF/FlaG flagellin family)
VESNSTVSAMTFNSTSSVLSFTVNGQTGTTGYVKATIAKSLVANTADLRVYIDGSQTEYSVNSHGDTWVLTFTYEHSAHYITVGWITKTTSNLVQYLPFMAAAAITAGVAAIVGYSVIRRRKRKETQAH